MGEKRRPGEVIRAAAAGRFVRRYRSVFRFIATFALLLGGVNLLFWVLVAARVPPVQQEYEEGRIVWLGRHALVFGHGYWTQVDGYWEHQTITRLEDGTLYRGPTLELLTRLRGRGAQTVWGSWCYSGNYPYIQKDLVTGREVPWPSFVSYNRRPGLTIPIWLGTTFTRIWWPEERYTAKPELIRYAAPDTIRLSHPSLASFASAFSLMRRRIRGLPGPDSMSWRAVRPGTVHSISWRTYQALSIPKKHARRELHLEPSSGGELIGTVRYWIRGRVFPVYIRVPAPAEPAFASSASPAQAGSEGQAGHAARGKAPASPTASRIASEKPHEQARP